MMSDNEIALRILLANTWVGNETHHLVRAEGECRDERLQPAIDFLRDNPSVLRLKMGMHAAARAKLRVNI